MTAKRVNKPGPSSEITQPGLTPAQLHQAACDALRDRAFPGFETFSGTMIERGRRVGWRPEFENEALPSVRIAVADRDGQIMDTSLVVDLRQGEPRLFWFVTPRGQARHAYTETFPGGLNAIAADVVVRNLTSLYTSALTG